MKRRQGGSIKTGVGALSATASVRAGSGSGTRRRPKRGAVHPQVHPALQFLNSNQAGRVPYWCLLVPSVPAHGQFTQRWVQKSNAPLPSFQPPRKSSSGRDGSLEPLHEHLSHSSDVEAPL